MSDINDPEHWRKRAMDARTLAADLNDPIAQAMMLQIAADYEKMRWRRLLQGAKTGTR